MVTLLYCICCFLFCILQTMPNDSLFLCKLSCVLKQKQKKFERLSALAPISSREPARVLGHQKVNGSLVLSKGMQCLETSDYSCPPFLLVSNRTKLKTIHPKTSFQNEFVLMTLLLLATVPIRYVRINTRNECYLWHVVSKQIIFEKYWKRSQR